MYPFSFPLSRDVIMLHSHRSESNSKLSLLVESMRCQRSNGISNNGRIFLYVKMKNLQTIVHPPTTKFVHRTYIIRKRNTWKIPFLFFTIFCTFFETSNVLESRLVSRDKIKLVKNYRQCGRGIRINRG